MRQMFAYVVGAIAVLLLFTMPIKYGIGFGVIGYVIYNPAVLDKFAAKRPAK
jgi:hypothetical protein